MRLEYPAETKERVLVKDGKWTVPPDQRPPNWRDILPEPANTGGELLERIISESARVREVAVSVATRKVPDLTDIREAIRVSGTDFGADGRLQNAALVLFCGIYSQDLGDVWEWTELPQQLVSEVGERCLTSGLWTPEGYVILGNIEDPKHGDLEFWMHAMAANGDIEYMGNGMFRNIQKAIDGADPS